MKRKSKGNWHQEYEDDPLVKEQAIDLSEKIEAMVNLYQTDQWSDIFMSSLFKYEIDRLLTPRERILVEFLVEGKSDRYIFNFLRHNRIRQSFTIASYQRMKASIKNKLKSGIRKTIPGWLKNISWNAEYDEHLVRD